MILAVVGMCSLSPSFKIKGRERERACAMSSRACAARDRARGNLRAVTALVATTHECLDGIVIACAGQAQPTQARVPPRSEEHAAFLDVLTRVGRRLLRHAHC